MAQETATSTFQRIKARVTQLEKHFRETTFYFSIKPRNNSGQSQITFSSPCSLHDFFTSGFSPLLQANTWIFFFGPDPALTPEVLATHRIPFTLLDHYNQTLFVCTPNHDQKQVLASHLASCSEYWLLGLAFAPTSEQLKAMGIVARSNALRIADFDFQGGFLLNFFPDPSFSGGEAKDFLNLIEIIFASELKKHFRLSGQSFEDPAALAMSTLRPLEHLDIVLEPLSSKEFSKTLLVHFTVSGFPKITISKLRWPSGKRFEIAWLEDHWSALTEKKFGTLKTVWDLVTSYFWPVLLLPVAIVIIPLTLILWPFYQFAKKHRIRTSPEDTDE